MTRIIYGLFFLTVAMLFSEEKLYAAFPVYIENTIAQTNQQIYDTEGTSSEVQFQAPVLNESSNGHVGNFLLSGGALALGIVGVSAMVIGVAFSIPVLWVVAVTCAVAAFVLGLKGAKRRPYRGIAIAAFISGIANVAILTALGFGALLSYMVFNRK